MYVHNAGIPISLSTSHESSIYIFVLGKNSIEKLYKSINYLIINSAFIRTPNKIQYCVLYSMKMAMATGDRRGVLLAT